MAQWTQTLEPYVKVQEFVRKATQNPTAGESLIIGVALISDAGPATPTLISNQSEFLSTYASSELTQDYLNSLNQLYTGADATTAATMWANAYRLSGSCTMLCVRASKATDLYFAKPLSTGDQNTYVLRDGELLKKMATEVKFVINVNYDEANHDSDGWAIAINGVGVFGNRTTDEGAQYDYYVNNLQELVDNLNDTSKFFSPSYTFYNDYHATIESSDPTSSDCVAVVFHELYLGVNVLDQEDPRMEYEASGEAEGETVKKNIGTRYLTVCNKDWQYSEEDPQAVIDLNDSAWSGFVPAPWYATNAFNSATDLKVRIRRFNHDAVVSKEITDTTSLTASSNSPFAVLTSVLDTFTQSGTQEPNEKVLERDFFEIAVQDPSVNDEVSFFNIGNILGRGDMEVSELNSLISMIQLNLPDDLHDLGLNYYGYSKDDNGWVEVEATTTENTVATFNDLANVSNPTVGDIYKVTETNKYYKYTENGLTQIFADLRIDPTETKVISVSDGDLKKALDLIALDEVYVTEGLCDLGNTELSYQNYMANLAINENYFYPISTVNSTNYMTIGNSITKISQDSYKLYASAPWDIDTGNLGWKFYACPGVLYWEAVARNRRNNEEFRGVFGQAGGIVQYQRPVVEFNKKSRQLLLSKRVNSVLWNTSTQAWNMNDNFTKQNEDTIMSDEGNSRLAIRISKAMPVLLRQFIGRKINQRLCDEMYGVIDYFFKFTILPMVYTIDAYNILVPLDEVLARKNKIKVTIQVRYSRSLKYVDVFHEILDFGMEFENA